MGPKYLSDNEDFSFPKEFGFTQSDHGRHDARQHPTDPDDQEYGDGSYVERHARGGKITMSHEAAANAVEGARAVGALQAAAAIKKRLAAAVIKGIAARRGRTARPVVAMADGGEIPWESQAAFHQIVAQGEAAADARNKMPDSERNQALADYYQAVGEYPVATPTPPTPKPKPQQHKRGGKIERFDIGGPVGNPLVPQMPVNGQPQPMRPQQVPLMAEGGKFIQKAVKRPGRLTKLAEKHGVSLGEEIAKDVHSKDPSLRGAALLGRRFRSGEFKHKGRKG